MAAEIKMAATVDESSERKVGFSFGFSKKSEPKKLALLPVNDNEQEHIEETDFVTSVDEKGITGSKTNSKNRKSEKLVIPLIKSNNWRDNLQEKDSSLDLQAVNEIIADSKRDNQSDNTLGTRQTLAIPLLLKNKPPDGFETEDRLDVSLRPDEAENADYDKMPIEDYGFAMLRGMGWKDGEGIGKDKKVIPTIDAVLRPKGLGLGADRGTVMQDQHGQSNEATNGDALEMKKGTCCTITSGVHVGLYGQIQGLDEDNARVVVKLALGSQLVTLSQYSVALVTEKEYKQSSHVLNKTKVDEYKKQESDTDRRRTENSDRGCNSNHRHSKHKKKRSRSCSRERTKKHKSHKHKNRDHSPSQQFRQSRDNTNKNFKYDNSNKFPFTSVSQSNSRPWLRSQLRVRIIDKSYLNGKYYNAKVVIMDVLTPLTCLCQTDDGKLLENISQDMLETVIPRSNPARIQFISGIHKGQIGEVIKRDKHNARASVQLLRDLSEIVTVNYNEICEYIGDVNHDTNF